jgi:serpin B
LIEKLIHGHQPFRLELHLPRFTLDSSDSLKESLGQMGMGIAFQFPGAEFAPLGSPLFFVGDVLHKTRLEIDEEGTVAAAVTAIVAPAGAAPGRVELKTLVFDRPFALLLCDTTTGVILFAGVVYEP